MKVVIRILAVIFIIELLVGGYFLASQLMRPVVKLPHIERVDPVINQQLNELAKKAETGTSEDWMSLAHALLGKGYYPDAEICFRRVTEMDPNNMDAVNSVAFCLDRTGRTREAIIKYKEVLAMAAEINVPIKNLEFSRYAIGCNYLREENVIEAEAIFSDIPNSIRAEYQYYKLLIRQDRASEIILPLKGSLETAPDSIKIHHLLMLAYESTSKKKLAFQAADDEDRGSYKIESFYNTSFVQPHSLKYGFTQEIEAHNRLVLLDKKDELAKELIRLLALIKQRRFPYKKELLQKLVIDEIRRKNPVKATEYLNQMIQLGSYNGNIADLQGDIFQLTGETNKMIAAWNQSFQLVPTIDLLQKLVDHYQEQKNEKQMNQHLALISFMKGKQKFHKNKLKEATELFQKSVNLNPHDEDAWFYHAQTIRLLGFPNDAKLAYEECLKLNPNYGRAIIQLERIQQNKK